MVDRPQAVERVRDLFRIHPSVAILGPRQCGKTTLARVVASIDRPEATTRFLILGSASPSLVKGVSESLAGRIGFLDLGGFDLRETGSGSQDRLWLRGGFPRSFLAPDGAASFGWRRDFLQTLLERDIPQLGISIPAEMLRRFWTMIAHYHGQI